MARVESSLGDCHATGETREAGGLREGDAREASHVEQRLAGIEHELAGLREVPGQLGAVLEALDKLQARFTPGEPPAPVTPKSLHSAPPEQQPTFVVNTASGEGPSVAPAPSSARLRQRYLQPVLSERSLVRSCTKSSTDSNQSEHRSVMRPLIGQPAVELPPPPTGVRQRRPSTQSDDPRAMQISRQRRPSTQSSWTPDPSRRPSVHSATSVVGGPWANTSPKRPQEVGFCLMEKKASSFGDDLTSPSVVGSSWVSGHPKKPHSAAGHFEKRASTCSDLAAPAACFDSVMPNSVPGPCDEVVVPNAMVLSCTEVQEEAEADALAKIVATTPPAMTSVPEGELETTLPSQGDGGGRASSSSRNRGSVNSSLSLGGESRPSIDCSNVMILGQDEEGPGVEKWVLHPNSCLRHAWDIFMVTLTIAVGLVVSVALSYHGDDVVTSAPYVVFLNMASGMWVLDIASNFFTGFYHQGKVVRSPQKIAERYIYRWLVADLLSAFPLVTPTGTAARVLSSLKLSRLLRLVTLLAGKQQDQHLLSLPSRVGIMVLITTMTTTCLWRLTINTDEARSGTIADPSQAWWEVFVTDIYWVTMTMSTVGFGDIAPVGTFSRMFAILAMLSAPIFFGTIVSLLTHVTQRIFNDEIEVQVAEASRFMRQRRLTLELQRRVEHNLRYQIQQERLTLKPALFAKLSTAVQREISLELLRSSVLNFPLFRGVLHSFIAELAQAHTWVQCLPGDLVVEEGQLMEEVVFVIRGRLMMHGDPELEEEVAGDVANDEEHEEPESEMELCAGAWFGEASLFFSDHVRTVTVIAAAESELAVLLSSDYHRIVQKYPRLLKRHQAISKALHMGNLSLRDVAYTGPEETLSEQSWRMGVVSRGSWSRLCRFFSSGGH